MRRRVVGIGGVFFKARNPRKLAEWYRVHLGIDVEDNMALFTWRAERNPKRKGHTVWSIFPRNTRYFGSGRIQFMLNYRVRNLRQLLEQLRKEGVRAAKKIEESRYGRFAWVTDSEGNRVELWEPPKKYSAPENEIPSE